MTQTTYQIFSDKVILRLRGKICETADELLSSDLFRDVLAGFIAELDRRDSIYLNIFPNRDCGPANFARLLTTLRYLVKLPVESVVKVYEDSHPLVADKTLFFDFVEQLYNYWRRLHRAVICDTSLDQLDKRPYRTFSETVETLMHVVRSTYRDIQENISGTHPRVYRQVSAGAEIGAIALPAPVPYPNGDYACLTDISVIRQILIYPPMIYNTPTNKRKGQFERIAFNPLRGVELDPEEWICYPARVGELVIMIYFSIKYFELGFSLCNLFELAESEQLTRQPDAVYLFGLPEIVGLDPAHGQTVFYDDEEHNLLVGAIPFRDEFGYFGYLKKMILTLHNITMMKKGRLPFHGALFNLRMKGGRQSNICILGDSGAGKSETLEAMRQIAGDAVEGLTIIADDMGSFELTPDGKVIGYGTEIGAFVRLDDLQSGYALGQIDRTIIMNPDQINARVIIPITKFDEVVKGYPVDMLLYANNYDVVNDCTLVIQRFDNPQDALDTFRSGAVMSKGTTNTQGLVHTYFANIFGPPQYRDLHEQLAVQVFERLFDAGVYVGEIRTQLGVPGMEMDGPVQSARALLKLVS